MIIFSFRIHISQETREITIQKIFICIHFYSLQNMLINKEANLQNAEKRMIFICCIFYCMEISMIMISKDIQLILHPLCFQHWSKSESNAVLKEFRQECIRMQNQERDQMRISFLINHPTIHQTILIAVVFLLCRMVTVDVHQCLVIHQRPAVRMGYALSKMGYHTKYTRVPLTICPLSKRQIQLCAFLIRGGKRITPVRFCGYASPKLKMRVCTAKKKWISVDLPTRHAEIAVINELSLKGRQMRLLRKTSLIVVRFIQRPQNMNTNDQCHDQLSFACSRPCTQCIQVLCALNLKSIIYVNEDGWLRNVSPNKIQGSVCSGGTRAHLSAKK